MSHRLRRRGAASIALAIAILGGLLPAAGPALAGSGIVVTTPILGAVVRELVGDAAPVTVLMDPGTDPHEWTPSAREIGALYDASLVIANGLGLEEGLTDILSQAEADGIPVVHATDWVSLRALGEPGHDDGPSPAPGSSPLPAVTDGGGDDHDHGPADPHFWTDPIAMRDVVDGLADRLAQDGLDVSAGRERLDAELTALDAELVALLAPIPPERRRLVTGHESMGYFADRYGFTLVGAVIPGLSSQGEVSAQALGALANAIREAGVTVVFVEAGTPQAVADAVAAETGARLVVLPSHALPADGSYLTYLREIGRIVAESLA